MKEITINYKSFDLIVKGSYIPSFDFNNQLDPPEPAEFYIKSILIVDGDFGELNINQWDIEQLCIEKLKE